MLKYLGSVGAFVRLNDSENKTYKLLEIFSSSAASELLFSASVNNLNGSVIINTASTSIYVNGNTASVLPSQQWAHVTFSFDDKLWTYDSNNFLVRFGDTASSNFNLQNVYILDNSFSSSAAAFLHEEFTGGTSMKVRVSDSASYSFNITDAIETNFISASTNVIYQPLKNQNRYAFDLYAATEDSLFRFVSASLMTNDNLYVDTVGLIPGSKVLSLADNQVYELTASSNLSIVSASVGDIFKVLYGQYLSNTFFAKSSASFTISPARVKIASYVNRIQPNNT